MIDDRNTLINMGKGSALTRLVQQSLRQVSQTAIEEDSQAKSQANSVPDRATLSPSEVDWIETVPKSWQGQTTLLHICSHDAKDDSLYFTILT